MNSTFIVPIPPPSPPPPPPSLSIRKKQGVMESLSGMVFGQKMDSYTTAELHAEIFYAECNMLQSLLTFFQVVL